MHSKSYKNSVFLSICVFVFKMSVSKPKRQHTDRTLKEKIEILGKLDSGSKAVDACKRFNICRHSRRCLLRFFALHTVFRVP